MTGPAMLRDIRVLDLSRVMSGPFCTSMLADLGAEVIKIEVPGAGDEGRSFGPFKEGASTYFMLLNRNKRSVTLNLKTAEGRNVLRSLIPKCDVLVENFRPGVMERLHLDEPSVRELNPDIVYASISGFGQESPLRDWPAFDLVIQAMSGLMSTTGPKGGPPTAVGESIADVCSGLFAAFGIVTALFDRERGGKGRHVDISMLDSVLAMQLTGLSRQLFSGDTPSPVGNRHPVTYPVDSFPTLDGDIVLVCFSNAGFAALSSLLGRPDLATDPRFATNAARNENEDRLRRIISGWTASRTREEAIRSLLDAGIPAAPVWNLSQAVESGHARSRGLVIEGVHGQLGAVPLVPQPVRFSGLDHVSAPTTPMLGEHTEEVLGRLAELDAPAIRALRSKQVL